MPVDLNPAVMIKIMDIPVTAVTDKELLNNIDGYIQSGQKQKVIGYTNLHGIYLAIKHDVMCRFYNMADMNYVDGTPVIWMANFLGNKLNYSQRITFIDLQYGFFELCNLKKYKVLWIGGDEESIKKGTDKIRAYNPGVQLKGVNGYKSEEEYLKIIKDEAAHVIILGMGMPRQENWVLNNIQKIDVNVVWCVGATIDFISEKAITPPRWSGKMGIEWVFRLINEPKRMFPRYVIEPFYILYHLIIKKKAFRKNVQ